VKWVEGQGDERHGDDPGDRPCDQLGHQRHHRHVDADHDRGQDAVDQRPVDDQVDVPHAVAQDGHGDRGREGDERQRVHDVAVAAGGERTGEERQHRERPETHPLELVALAVAGAAIPQHERGHRQGDRRSNQQRRDRLQRGR
jgi:hypothetical protein